MKKSAIIITAFLLPAVTALRAQKAVSEGTFTYAIAMKASGSNASSGTASSVLYVKGNLSRIDMASSLGNEKTIHDAKSGTAVILKEYSGQKLMITLTKANWAEKNKRSAGLIFSDENEQKEILGYQCTRATSKMDDGSTISVLYTKEIQLQNKDYNPLFKNLPGLPMQYEVSAGNMTFVYTMTKIDLNSISQTKFDYPKTGYRVITYDENKQANKK